MPGEPRALSLLRPELFPGGSHLPGPLYRMGPLSLPLRTLIPQPLPSRSCHSRPRQSSAPTWAPSSEWPGEAGLSGGEAGAGNEPLWTAGMPWGQGQPWVL